MFRHLHPINSWPQRALLAKPSSGVVEFAGSEVAHLGGCEGFAEARHQAVPGLLSNDGETLDLVEVSGIPFHVFPKPTGIPAVKIMHCDQNADLPMLADHPLGLRDKHFIIFAPEFPVEINFEELVVNNFFNVCGRIHMCSFLYKRSDFFGGNQPHSIREQG